MKLLTILVAILFVCVVILIFRIRYINSLFKKEISTILSMMLQDTLSIKNCVETENDIVKVVNIMAKNQKRIFDIVERHTNILQKLADKL